MKKQLTKSVSFIVLLVTLIPVVSLAQIQNPLAGVNDVGSFVSTLLGFVFRIGSILSVLFLIYSGYLFVVARGNPGELTKAKDTFKWTIIGIAILLGADVIANIIIGTITNINS